jgi:hypothetical protein
VALAFRPPMSTSGRTTGLGSELPSSDAVAAWTAHYDRVFKRYRESHHRRGQWLSFKRRRRARAALITTGVMGAAAVLAFLIALLSAP